MKILLIGDFTGIGNEGLTQVSKRIAAIAQSYNQTLTLNTKEVLKPKNLYKIIRFNPEIIHYVTGITIRSLIIAKIIKLICLNKPKIILSAVRVFLTPLQIKLIKIFKPNLILTQASKWENIFKKYGIPTKFLANPIDTDKFCIVDYDKKLLREKYNLPEVKKIVLHVGHIKKNRNLECLLEFSEKFKKYNYQIVIVSSPFFKEDTELANKLRDAGFIIINGHIEKIEEIYNASDIYFFPVLGLGRNYYPKSYDEVGVIDMPLSVLEAISVGLPVVTTEIDSLYNLFELDKLKNIVIWDGRIEIILLFERIINLKQQTYCTSTNKYSYQNVHDQLNSIYQNMVR